MAYREIAPPARLADSVECFWSSSGTGLHRVFPDGCADILFQHSGKISVVGAMTAWRDVDSQNDSYFGVRFRPGGWAARFRLAGDVLTDRMERLDSLWGARAGELVDRLGSAASDEARAAIVESILDARPRITPAQRAIAWMEQRRGLVAVDDLADQCGLSARQFRRVCLAETGLTPKFLARVLRFRHALSRVAAIPGADLALHCGYYDQAHFINEFREFAGRTPSGK